MKNNFFYLTLIFISLLFSGCKKDDVKLTTNIYGEWTSKIGFIKTGREWDYYTFSEPNLCFYNVELADRGMLPSFGDTLTFEIKNSTLSIYNKSGTKFREFTIVRLTGSSLHLKYSSGDILKLGRW